MIEVLFIQIPAGANRDKMFAGLRSVVSKECYAEVLGYGNKEVALRRLLGEALVRFALKKYWNLTSEDYRIDRGEKGKPFIVGVENVFFNISHSGDYVVCAVSDREIGIDIEKRTKARMEVAGRFFHGEEVAQLKMLEEDKQDQLFFNYWSVKESFLKYIGTGLTRPLNSFIVSFSGGDVSLFEGGNKLPLYVHACPVDDGYACHVCCEYEELTGIHEIFLEEITGC
ncbi:MAG: 4'-phosphopantetheinyl transferase superfamily protein [Bacteroidales bacterium]|nr:4'-phosphopantetheinyl transferase superfamily protein [Bacteroidales bacterium]